MQILSNYSVHTELDDIVFWVTALEQTIRYMVQWVKGSIYECCDRNVTTQGVEWWITVRKKVPMVLSKLKHPSQYPIK